jgi:hypothetical protein
VALLAIRAEEGVEEPVHVTREGLGLHQKSHVHTSIQTVYLTRLSVET